MKKCLDLPKETGN